MDTITRMRAFISVADQGGYSAAARSMGRSKALVSKYVTELEAELGARLLNRTTRQVSLTEAGEAVYDEAREVVDRIDRLRETISENNTEPRGRLRISAPRAIGDVDMSRAFMEFLAAYPDIRLELHLEDRFADIVEEGFDAAIRIAELTDSSLIARKLAGFRIVICAAPSIIKKYGRPEHPRELADMPCVIDTNYRSRNTWHFGPKGDTVSVPVKGRIEVNSPIAAARAAVAGLGYSRGPWVLMRDDIAAGRLVTVLDEFESVDLGIFAVYPHRERMPAKLRAFIDFMVAWYDKERKAGRTC